MGGKSKQHYVPKFYLKNFSDSKKSIDTYNITTKSIYKGYVPKAQFL
ncbi:DUF4238 domain-containing protein [Bacillus salipaludis]|uniref:DUF4238 domain-containing protein n=1 Tax=Bacillus salipaludis TaxID=2547811 RepID=A0ABW8RG92_9BACI